MSRVGKLRLEIGLALAKLAKEDCAVAEDNAAGNPPLAAIVEEGGANDLNEDQRDEEISDTATGTGHNGPTIA